MVASQAVFRTIGAGDFINRLAINVALERCAHKTLNKGTDGESAPGMLGFTHYFKFADQNKNDLEYERQVKGSPLSQ